MDFAVSLCHPSELWALVRFRFLGGSSVISPQLTRAEEQSADLMKCYAYLDRTSRSFAAVIRAVRNDSLRPALAVFYLVLRALDTVEDDMTIEREEKVSLLCHFHTFLQQPDWSYQKSQDKDRVVLQDFPTISRAFRSLPVEYRNVIVETTQEMGTGFAECLEKPVQTLADWDRYCYLAAGLVGIAFTRIISAGQEISAHSRDLSVAMGLFLQKTNITRDYLDDVTQDRHFWPEEVWRQYSRALSDFRAGNSAIAAVSCLNELITLTLEGAPKVIEYLEQLTEPSVFSFCAIPQVMAVSTLLLCYDNRNVFRGPVKLRKGQTVSLILEATSVGSVKSIFCRCANQLRGKVRSADPSSARTRRACDAITEKCGENQAPKRRMAHYLIGTGLVLVLAYSMRYRLHSWALTGIQAVRK